MATGYTLNFTYDPNGNLDFQLAPYTTNGPVSPNSDILDAKATDANSTLLLLGKGSPDYGERVAENLIHLVENFSSDQEPVRPINGQLWNDTSGPVSQLKVFNHLKYEIITDPLHSNGNFFGMNPPSATEEAEMFARFNEMNANNYTLSIIEQGSLNKERYGIANVYNDGGLVTVQVTPSPVFSRTVGNWFIGGWERVLQNNAPLAEDFNAGGWKIYNLAAQTSPAFNEAATVGWVTSEIATQLTTQNQIGELTDVASTASTSANPDEILIYNGSVWENLDGGTLFLKLSTGGTLGGTLDMNNNFIQNLPSLPGYPSAPHHAATMEYVDVQIAAIAAPPTELSDLSDVTTSANPATDSLLQWNGSQWVDIHPIALPYLPTTGGTMTGNLTLSGPGHANAPGLAATENYVNSQISTLSGTLTASFTSQINALPDEDYITVGSFNSGTQTLTLNRLQGGTVIIPMTGAGGDSSGIAHVISDPNTGNIGVDIDVEENGGLTFEELFWNVCSYPDISVEDALMRLSATLGRHVAPIQSLIFTSNGSSTIYLGDTSGGAQPNQCNPTGLLNHAYVAGQNNLQVFVNGVKQYASERGYFKVFAKDPTPATTSFAMFPGTRTGLNTGVAYNFNVNVNGQGVVNIAIPASAQNATMGGVMQAINAVADAQFFDSGSPNSQYAFGVRLLGGVMEFFSCLPGSSSSIVVTDGFFFNEFDGDLASTGEFEIAQPISAGFGGDSPTPPTNYLPATRGYQETGRVFKESQEIIFETGSIPASGATIEVRIDREIFGERL